MFLKENYRVIGSKCEIERWFSGFFSDLFGKATKSLIHIDWSLILGAPALDFSKLVHEFTLKEIKEAIFLFDGFNSRDLMDSCSHPSRGSGM